MNLSKTYIDTIAKFVSCLGLNINDIDLNYKSWEIFVNNEYSIIFELRNDHIFYILQVQVESSLLSDKIAKISELINTNNIQLSEKIVQVCKFGESNIALIVKEEINPQLSGSQIEDSVYALSKVFYQVREV